MDILGIIPARYQSTRFPGKPLAILGDKTVIQRVYEQSQKVIDEVYVATDDHRIFTHVKEFGGNVIMTSEKHPSGTDRCREAMDSIIAGTGIQPEIIINIQGDEPFIDPRQIELLVSCFDDDRADIATLVKKAANTAEIFDENKPKVVFDNNNFALYFSRSVIPFIRGEEKDSWIINHNFYRHLGIYAYRKEVLQKITRLALSNLETSESLEQLRWLENGFRIKVAETDYDTLGIDTPADLEKARNFLKNQ
ncbi:MAG: 3-deoxy-manno-octulosonate cytidylyltransferase [Bacteroidales bacterium]